MSKYFDCQNISHNLKIFHIDNHRLRPNIRSYVVKYRAEKIFKHACMKKTIPSRMEKIME